MDLLKGLQIPSAEIFGEIRFENVCFSYPSRPDQVHCATPPSATKFNAILTQTGRAEGL